MTAGGGGALGAHGAVGVSRAPRSKAEWLTGGASLASPGGSHPPRLRTSGLGALPVGRASCSSPPAAPGVAPLDGCCCPARGGCCDVPSALSL